MKYKVKPVSRGDYLFWVSFIRKFGAYGLRRIKEWREEYDKKQKRK